MSIETKGPSDEIRALAREAREVIHVQSVPSITQDAVRTFLTNNRVLASFRNPNSYQTRYYPSTLHRRNNFGGTYGGRGKSRVP